MTFLLSLFCRQIFKPIHLLIHHEKASDIQIRAQEILRLRAKLNGLYVEHTGQPLDEIERVMDRDTFMDAEQALKFGIVDEVLVKRPDDEDIPKPMPT